MTHQNPPNRVILYFVTLFSIFALGMTFRYFAREIRNVAKGIFYVKKSHNTNYRRKGRTDYKLFTITFSDNDSVHDESHYIILMLHLRS